MANLKTVNITLKIASTSRAFLNISRNMCSAENDVVFETKNNVGIIILNRPKALNALNLSMVNKIHPKLKEWENTKKIIIMKGAGEKSFCAGGDVKSIVLAGLRGEKLGEEFFKREYSLDGDIGKCKIPYIALIDGITMGGGVGLSVHGPYRVATERTLFAMPETAIGLFPDVGGSYFLPRMKHNLGAYLGLTGFRLKGLDILHAGIATHFCPSDKISSLENELVRCENDNDIRTVLCEFQPSEIDCEKFSLAPYLEQIDKCFSADTVEEIVSRLKEDNSPWAENSLKLICKMSPTSLKVTLEEIRRGSKMTLEQCLNMEYQMSLAALSGHDFFEGVRALLIDKDQSPKWKPETLEGVTSDIVQSYFKEETNLLHKL